jgi:hypothetical protein
MLKKNFFAASSVALIVLYLFFAYSGMAEGVFAKNICFLIAAFTPVFASAYLVASFGLKNKRGKTFLLLNLGFLLFFIGEVLWFVSDYYFNVYPFPSVIDFFYLIAYPVIFVGLINEANFSAVDFSIKKNIKFFLIALVSALAVFYIGVYRPYDSESDLLSNLITLFYGVGDVILIIVSFFIVKILQNYGEGKMSRPWFFIAMSMIAMLVADILFAFFPEQYDSSLNIQSITDVFWMASYLLFGYGVVVYYRLIKSEEINISSLSEMSKYFRCVFKRNFYVALFFILGVLHLSFSFFSLKGGAYFMIERIVYILAILLAVYGCFYTARVYGRRNSHGKTFIYLAVAIFLLMSGEISWTAEQFYSYRLTSNLAISDLLLVVIYPLLFLASYYELKAGNYKHILIGKKGFVWMIFSLALVLIVYFDIVLPFNINKDSGDQLISLIFGFGDILVFVSIFFLLLMVRTYQKGRIFIPWLTLMASVILMIIGDIVLGVFTKNHQDTNLLRLIISNIWIIACLFVGYGAISLGCIIQQKQEEARSKLNQLKN